MNIQNFISELKRRNVFRIATAYTISGWLIIQVADTVFPAFNFPDWTTQFVIIIVAIGFPVTLVISWAFELTPQGLKTTKEVDENESLVHSTGKKLNKVIIGTLSLLVIFLLTERIFFAESTLLDSELQEASIAVLPFVNMSGDEQNEYFSDGLSEELLNVLAQVDELDVAGRTSSFKFKGQNENLSLIGEELKVNHILEGSVRKAGDRIRITAQLIKVEDGYHLWSETYDRELTTENIFDIQDEISNAVLAELKIQLLNGGEINTEEYTQDIEAYNLYLAGTQLEKNRITEELEAAAENYKTAIRLDPSFALAYARLAWVYYLLHEYGNITRDELLVLMRENIDKALSIDPTLGKAVLADAVYYRYSNEPEKGLEASERAIELIPNDPETWIVRRNAIFYGTSEDRDFEGMEKATKRAYELDKNNPAYANMYARTLPSEGKHEEALEILDRINRLSPDFGPAYGTKARIYSEPPYAELDNAFLVIFEQYKQNETDLNLLTELLRAAINIDFTGMENYLSQKILELYPNNRNAIIPIMFYMVKNRMHKESISFLENAEENGIPVQNWMMNFSNLFRSLNNSDYDSAFVYFIALNPDFDEENLEEVGLNDVLNYALLKELAGDSSVKEELAPMICRRAKEEIKQEESEIEKAYLEYTCEIAQDDIDGIYNLGEKMYFELMDKDGMMLSLSTDPSLNELVKKHPKLAELKSRILADIHSMRANVIEELKAKGDWKEEWAESN